MKMIRVSHANEADTVVDVVLSNLFYVYWSKAQRATVIVSNGGAFIPIKESLDDVNRLIAQAESATTPIKGE